MRPAIPPLDALNRALPTVRTTDAAVARRCLDHVFAPHRLEVAGGPLNFAHQHVSLGESSISLLRYGSEVDIVAPPLGFYLLQVTLQGRIGLRASGFDVTLEAGSAFVMNPGVGYRKCWDREAQQLMIKIPRRHLESCVSGTANMGPSRKIEFAPTALPADALAGPLRQLLNQLGCIAQISGVRCRPSSAVRKSENNVVKAVLSGIAHRVGPYRDPMETGAVPRYVWRAERHLHANSRSSVNLDALAQVAGVSKRTLQEGFRRFRGKPPNQISRDLRLDLAREALIQHGPENVTEVALEYGFAHLGRFAEAYAARFGECPSETLRRRQSA